MKDFIKNRLNEGLVFELIQTMMDEEYPSTFNMEHFKTLRKFAERVRYCEEHLKRISSGTARIVYMVDNTKVLKLAKNEKGLAQCGVEIEYGQYHDLDGVVAKIFEYDEKNLWVEMQLARKLTPTLFKQISGFSFEDFQKAVNDYGMDSGNGGSGYKSNINPQIMEQMWENEFTYGIFQFIGNYGVPVGDLKRLNSYGIVSENGENSIVIIDYGLTSDVYTSYYA